MGCLCLKADMFNPKWPHHSFLPWDTGNKHSGGKGFPFCTALCAPALLWPGPAYPQDSGGKDVFFFGWGCVVECGVVTGPGGSHRLLMVTHKGRDVERCKMRCTQLQVFPSRV